MHKRTVFVSFVLLFTCTVTVTFPCAAYAQIDCDAYATQGGYDTVYEGAYFDGVNVENKSHTLFCNENSNKDMQLLNLGIGPTSPGTDSPSQNTSCLHDSPPDLTVRSATVSKLDVDVICRGELIVDAESSIIANGDTKLYGENNGTGAKGEFIADNIELKPPFQVELGATFYAHSESSSSGLLSKRSSRDAGANDDNDRVTSLKSKKNEKFELTSNRPNPFAVSTTIRFAVPKAVKVQVEIFDVAGRRIDQLMGERVEAGFHEITWNPTHLPSGIYFCRMIAGRFQASRKMVLVNR